MTRRRRRWLIVLLVLAAAAAFLWWWLPGWTARLVAERLSDFFQRKATVEDVRLGLFPLQVEILGLRVAGATPDAEPFLEVPRTTFVPTVESLFTRRVVLARLRLERAKLRVNAYRTGGDDIPKTRPGSGPGTEVRIRRLTIDQAEFHLNHARVPLDLDLPHFEGRLARLRGGTLAGALSFRPGRLRFGTAPPFSVGTDMQVTVDGSLLKVESAHLRGEGTDLAYTGSITLARRPKGRFHLRGPVDLDVLERHVMRTGFGIRGDGRWDGTLDVDGSQLRLDGRLSGTAGVFDAVPVPRYDMGVRLDETGTHLRDMQLETLGGRGVLQIEIPKPVGPVTLHGRYEAVDAERAARFIFDMGAPGLGAAATGDVSLSWPRGRFRELSGRVQLDLAPNSDGRRPLGGRFEWRAEAGVQFIEKADLRTPVTRARLSGRIDLDGGVDLSVDGESADLAASDDLLVRLRRALGAPEAAAAGFSGAGVFRGRWRGTLARPVIQGRFSGRDLGYLGVVWGRAEWSGTLDSVAVDSRSLVLRRGGTELWLDGRIETGYYGETDGLDVRLRLTEWPAEDLITALAWDVDVRGPVTGEATLGGRRSAPRGSSRVRSQAGRYYGVPFQELELRSEFSGHVTRVTTGRAQVGGGRVAFRGSVTDDGVYDGRAEAEDVDIGDVVPQIRGGVPWGGRVTAEATLHGTLTRPRLQARLTSPRLFVGDEGIGALDATLQGTGDGRVGIAARCRSPRLDVELAGSLGAAPPYAAALTLTARQTSLDPYLRVAYPALPALLGIVASGEANLHGPLTDPLAVRLQGQVSALELSVPEYPIRSQAPLHLALETGRLDVRGLHLAGEGTDLQASGTAAVLTDGPLDLDVRGEADLRTLSAVTGRLRGRGAARLTLAIAGTRDQPRLDGGLAIEGAGLRVRGFPHGLEGVHGTLRFTEREAHFDAVTGTLAGGPVELRGQMAYAQGRLASFDVSGTGRGLTLRYPEGLRSVIDAELRYFGDLERQWVTGEVDVRHALWSRRHDVASELLAAREGLPEPVALAGPVRYDIQVRAPGTLRVDNNLATLQGRADLVLQGTYGDPVVLGRAEIDRGQVYFQGNTYLIRRGTLDFANPQRTDPVFDIEAETRIRSYRVTLKLNGTLERVYPTLTSDPPLTALQILNLLAGADEATVVNLSQVQSDQARLAAAGAATLAAGRIAEEVGLEREAERLFGLNRFSIDPSVVRGGVTNPTARLTVGKRITPNLSVLYSVDLRGTEERLVSVEYHLSDRFSLLLTSDAEGYGFDLRLRQTY